VSFEREAEEERLWAGEVELDDVARWRPFRPVLRDAAARPAGAAELPAAAPSPATR
jgi:hypothetical protein